MTFDEQVRVRPAARRREIATGKRTEEQLRAREQQLRIVSELMSDCCWIRWEIPDGTVRREWISGSFERLTGYSTEEFEAMGREGLILAEDLPEALNFVSGPPGVSEHEFRIMTKSGEVRWLHERMRVTREEDGTTRIYGATRDITDQRLVEQALKNSRDELHQAQKIEALGRLAGGIAHDFNNVLMGIVGYSDLLVEALGEESRPGRYAVGIRKAAQRATSLTGQLLAFSRKQPLDSRLVDLDSLIGELEQMLRHLLPESVELRVDLDAGRVWSRSTPGNSSRLW